MKFAIASVSYWDSIGMDSTKWRKSLDGTKALCHLSYAERLGINLHATPEVTIYDNVDTEFEDLLSSPEWSETSATGDPDSFSILNELNQFETNINNAVSQKTADLTAQLQQKASNLQGQINHLVLDSGESDTEVAQGRVDARGRVFSTIKGRIDNVETIITDRVTELSSTWSQGTIDIYGNAPSTTRLRTDEYLKVGGQSSNEITINIAEGYQFNIVYFNDNKERISESGWKTTTQKIRIDYPLFRLSISKLDFTDITVEESINIYVYEKIDLILDNEITQKHIVENSITPNKVSFVHGQGQYNLFDGVYTRLYLEDGKVNGGRDYATQGLGCIIPVVGGELYYIQKEDSNRFRLGFSSYLPNIIGTGVSDAIPLDCYVDSPEEGVGYLAPDNAKYLIVFVTNLGEEPKLQVTVGQNYPFFTGYGVSLNLADKSVKTSALEDGENLRKISQINIDETLTHHFLGDINQIYKSAEIPLDTDLTNYEKLISSYDALVTAFPNYITRNSIGDDGFGNTMYEYVFRAPSIGNTTAYTPRRLKLLISTGTHGWEHMTTLAVYRFFHELCYNPREIEELELIKWNVDFKVVPSVTPSCYRTNRVNANGVNINRNFPTGWSATGENSGSSPASELETQNIMSWLESNLDAYYYIDYHAQAANRLSIYVVSDTSATIAQSVIRVYEKRWRELNDAEETYLLEGDIVKHVGGMTLTHSEHLGISAMIPDCPWIGHAHNPVVEQRIVLEIFANTIYSLIKKH